MLRQIGTALVDPNGGFEPTAQKMSTTLKLEAMNLAAQANAFPVARQRRRRTDEDLIRHWMQTGKWIDRFYFS